MRILPRDALDEQTYVPELTLCLFPIWLFAPAGLRMVDVRRLEQAGRR